MPRKKRDWNRDPSIKRRRGGGQPPDGHHRRCQSSSRRNPDKQCGQWARVGSHFCKYHGGNLPKHRTFDQMSWYARRAGPLLRERLEEMRSAAPDERHSLADEVDLARLVAERSVTIYDATVIQNQGSDDLKAMATAGLRSALNHVSDIVGRAAKVHAVSSTVIELEHIDYILQQVTRIVEEDVAEKDKVLAGTVIGKIAKIKLPESRSEADAEETARRVRDAIRDMDTTVGGVE